MLYIFTGTYTCTYQVFCAVFYVRIINKLEFLTLEFSTYNDNKKLIFITTAKYFYEHLGPVSENNRIIVRFEMINQYLVFIYEYINSNQTKYLLINTLYIYIYDICGLNKIFLYRCTRLCLLHKYNMHAR